MTDDREAIIEAMAVAARDKFGELDGGGIGRDDWRAMMRAAYDASPLERYRLALEQIAGSPFGSSHEVDRGIAERALRGE